MNEWCIYIALCVLLYTQCALQSCGGVSPQPSPVCSIHLDDATAATGQRRQCTHHTPATGGEERESSRQSSECTHYTPATGGEERESSRQSSECTHYTPATGGEESVIEPIKCMLSPHTSYRWRGERVIESIKWMGIIRRPWLIRARGGNLARTNKL